MQIMLPQSMMYALRQPKDYFFSRLLFYESRSFHFACTAGNANEINSAGKVFNSYIHVVLFCLFFQYQFSLVIKYTDQASNILFIERQVDGSACRVRNNRDF